MASFAAVLLNCAFDVEGPETTLHAPVPAPGTLAAKVTLGVVMQIVWSGPAFEAVGAGVTFTANCAVVALVPPLSQVVVAT